MGHTLNPKFFGAKSCGNEEHPNGTWLQKRDIYDAIEYILSDDDQETMDRRLRMFLNHLKEKK